MRDNNDVLRDLASATDRTDQRPIRPLITV
jgi:hypothetical protein